MMQYYQKALAYATEKHRGQLRKDGVPYITHPIAVDKILAESGICDDAVRSAALLHDVLEDCEVTVRELEREFGPKIVNYVFALTRTEGQNRQDYIRDLDRSSLEVQLLKLADVAHNSSTIECLTEENQKRMAGDIKSFYLPLAEKICVGNKLKKLKKRIQENLARYIIEKELISNGPMTTPEVRGTLAEAGLNNGVILMIESRFEVKTYGTLLKEYEENYSNWLRKCYNMSLKDKIWDVGGPEKKKKQKVPMKAFLREIAKN